MNVYHDIKSHLSNILLCYIHLLLSKHLEPVIFEKCKLCIFSHILEENYIPYIMIQSVVLQHDSK